jgi:hypothetical protein
VDKPVLTDPNSVPNEKIVFGHLGKARSLWREVFMEMERACYPYPLSTQWIYMQEAGGWMLKVMSRSRRVCTVTVARGAFLISTYFHARVRRAIAASDLPAELKEQFATGPQVGRSRSVTLRVSQKQDVELSSMLWTVKTAAKVRSR